MCVSHPCGPPKGSAIGSPVISKRIANASGPRVWKVRPDDRTPRGVCRSCGYPSVWSTAVPPAGPRCPAPASAAPARDPAPAGRVPVGRGAAHVGGRSSCLTLSYGTGSVTTGHNGTSETPPATLREDRQVSDVLNCPTVAAPASTCTLPPACASSAGSAGVSGCRWDHEPGEDHPPTRRTSRRC